MRLPWPDAGSRSQRSQPPQEVKLFFFFTVYVYEFINNKSTGRDLNAIEYVSSLFLFFKKKNKGIPKLTPTLIAHPSHRLYIKIFL